MGRPEREPAPATIGARLGASIRATRKAIGWTEREMADRLGTNQAAVQRLEAGRQRHLDVALATVALDHLGIRLTLDADPVGLGARREQRDLVHARCCGYVIRQLERRGWATRTEVEIGDGRVRGWIDILAWRQADAALMVIEVKTQIDDAGRLLRTVGWYVRSSRAAADQFGWRPRRIVPVVALLATVEADTRLTASADLVRQSFPGGADRLGRWIADPELPQPDPSVVLIDPRSRRDAWLRRPRVDGGRALLPYRDYGDAATALAPTRQSSHKTALRAQLGRS